MGSPEIPVLGFWGRVLAIFYVLVNLRTRPTPTPSTPKNIDLHDSTPALISRFFTGATNLFASRMYSFANRLVRGWSGPPDGPLLTDLGDLSAEG